MSTGITADSLRKILKEQYGIESDEEFLRAYEASPGLNIGIFVQPLNEAADGNQKECEMA